MTTIAFTLTLIALLGCALVLAGLMALASRHQAERPEFARITNGRDTDDALKSHRR